MESLSQKEKWHTDCSKGRYKQVADNIQFDAAAVQAAVQEGIDKLNSAATLDE